MKFFKKATKSTTRKYAVIRTTSKGFTCEMRAPRVIIHGGDY